MIRTLRQSALLALVTALWCWLLSACHGIWSFGIVHGYLDGGRIPLHPSLPVTYAGFFLDAFGAFLTPLVLVFLAGLLVPPHYSLTVVITAWLIGAWLGAANTAFVYQIDFGMTWTSWEAVHGLYYHPIVTPIWLILGVAGAVSLTRPLRRP